MSERAVWSAPDGLRQAIRRHGWIRRPAEFLTLRIWPYPFAGLVWGCCGCGIRFADVISPPCEGAPHGEGYCWECAVP